MSGLAASMSGGGKMSKKRKRQREESLVKKREREACVCPFMRGDVDAEPGSQQ